MDRESMISQESEVDSGSCPNCGRKVDQEDTLCSKCGAQLIHEAVPVKPNSGGYLVNKAIEYNKYAKPFIIIAVLITSLQVFIYNTNEVIRIIHFDITQYSILEIIIVFVGFAFSIISPIYIFKNTSSFYLIAYYGSLSIRAFSFLRYLYYWVIFLFEYGNIGLYPILSFGFLTDVICLILLISGGLIQFLNRKHQS